MAAFINGDFFSIDPSCAHIVPDSLTSAIRLATHILRSEHHKTILISLYDDHGPHHIDLNSLTALVNQNGVVSINKIRLTGFLHARAVVMKEYDPWTILLNPLLLTEAQDREREDGEQPDFVGEDLLCDAQPFEDLTKTKRNPPRPFNQLAFVQQMERKADKKRKARDYAEAFFVKRASTKAPTFLTLDTLSVLPSEMSVQEKNTLMLTILLLNKAHHIISHALGSFHSKPNQPLPAKIFSHAEGIDSLFDDVGHLMERHLWGFCIGHAGEPHAPTPFGIHEIIGTLWQNKGKKSILVASAPLRALLNNPYVTPMPPVSAELLRLSPTSGGEFTQKASTVVLGRFSAGNVGPEWENAEDEDEDAEEEAEEHGIYFAENKKLPGSALFNARR
eukprot:gene9872-11586_t